MREYFVTDPSGTVTKYVNPNKDFPTVLRTGRYEKKGKKKGKKNRSLIQLFAWATADDGTRDTTQANGRWVTTWDAIAPGTWWIIDPKEKEWQIRVVELSETAVKVAKEVERAMRKAFRSCKNYYEAALMYQKMQAQYQDQFKFLSKSVQIELLKVPDARRRAFREGRISLEQHIADFALTKKMRQDRRKQREIEEERRQDQEFWDYVKLNPADYDDVLGVRDIQDSVKIMVGDAWGRAIRGPESLPQKPGDVRIKMRLTKGEKREIDNMIEFIQAHGLHFPKDICRLIYQYYCAACAARWIDNLPLAADEAPIRNPDLHMLITLSIYSPSLHSKCILRCMGDANVRIGWHCDTMQSDIIKYYKVKIPLRQISWYEIYDT